MAVTPDNRHRRFHAPHAHLGTTFGEDWFGRWAEHTARIFGTPLYLITQTALVIIWIAINAAVISFQWTPTPSSCSTSRSVPRPPTPRR